MPDNSAIVLVIDALGAKHLGPYGNTWIETPALNQLAAQSFLCEQALIDTPRLERLYRSYWQGRHAMCPDAPASASTSLAGLLRDQGVSTTLLTDEPEVAEHRLSGAFDERIVLSGADEARVADDMQQTQLAQLLAAAVDRMHRAHPPVLLWVHARAMSGPWDAPLELRNQFVEEDDPQPPTSATVPDRLLTSDDDADQMLGVMYAYAGQIVMLDACLGALLDALAEGPLSADTLLVLTSSRGFPLGEHRRVGLNDAPLYGELLHVPWLMRWADGRGAAVRSQALVQPADLFSTLLEWYGLPPEPTSCGGQSLLPLLRDDQETFRQCAVAAGENEWAIRTPAWFMRADGAGDGDQQRPRHSKPPSAGPETAKDVESLECQGSGLFAKPDDRWEVNEVSGRCGDVVERLEEALAQFYHAAQTGDFSSMPPLTDILIEGLE